MGSRTRRDFLKLSATSLTGLALAGSPAAEDIRIRPRISSAYRTPSTLDRFIDPLQILKTLTPVDSHKGRDIYRVRMLECARQLHSQLPATRLWGYEGQYPGPTFETRQGRPVVVHWENRLPREHLFRIDPRIHGAMPPAPAVRTVPHLHGSRSPSESDGLPEKWFASGSSATYKYPNGQRAATLWYHDHAVGITRLNVYAGLSGFYLLRDKEEASLGLPSGNYEIALLLQDRTLDEQGHLVYSPAFEDGQQPPPGTWAPEFFGDLPVVNGTICPYLEVEPRLYRFRILNGSNSRFFRLFLNLARTPAAIPSLVTYHQIGTDGGLLGHPAAMTKLLLGPAERADILVDFSGLQDKVVTLSNDALSPFPGWDMINRKHASLYELMQFRVTLRPKNPSVSFTLPVPAVPDQLDESKAVATRDFILSETVDEQGRSLGVRINGKGYDAPLTEIVKLGSIEKWRFINTTDDAHPMHLHLVQFQIVERQGFNPTTVLAGAVELVGTPRRPPANEAGWKDTAVVSPGEVLTILVHFEGYAGRYVFHCHMLEHEDNDMMRPYEVAAGDSHSSAI